jgi:hypothetical protein
MGFVGRAISRHIEPAFLNRLWPLTYRISSFRRDSSVPRAFLKLRFGESMRGVASAHIFNPDPGRCSPRLQTRGFSSQLATKPALLKRRATTLRLPGEQTRGFIYITTSRKPDKF